MSKKYVFPEKYQVKIEAALEHLGFSLNAPKDLAKAILNLSDHYKDPKSTTPIDSKPYLAAYLSYFFPLNYIRTRRVLDQVLDVFSHTQSYHVLDYGAGVGTATLALKDELRELAFKGNLKISHKEVSKVAHQIFKDFLSDSSEPINNIQKPSEFIKASNNTEESIGLFSYSINELGALPEFTYNLDHLIFIEPSTKQCSHNLIRVRKNLIEKGFNLLAPCTHTYNCPLMDSKKDWCHDRTYWEPPEWFRKIEEHLPMKNQTMTLSYLVASRILAPMSAPDTGRVIGEPLVEKGKTRWLYCNGPDRLFLSWMKRLGPAPKIYRGQLYQPDIDKQIANELRLNSKEE